MTSSRSPQQPPARLAFVATSARSLVECARASGFSPIALDVFGDIDTGRLAEACVHIGGTGLAMERDALLAALAGLRARADVAGWVAGSGFEAQLDLLAEAARVLPLIGNRPEIVRRVRSPADFAALLDALGIVQPGFSVVRPLDARGWLVKDAHACGGWHVRPAEAAPASGLGEGAYFQRQVAGEAFSCLFVAAGGDARVLGFSRQIVRALGGRPYVYRGGAGPVALPSAAGQQIADAAQKLSRALGLVGLNGIDFVLDAAGQPWLLELNPRPTAAIQLFDDAFEGGLMRAHVEACAGRLPVSVSAPASSPVCGSATPASTGTVVRGFETVFARRAGQVDAASAAWLAGQGWCCDIPRAGTRPAWGDPVCTVRAQADSVEAVLQQLSERRRRVMLHLQPRAENPTACR
ncbi:MAG: ATP-grasp domain-containing protein [Thauera sp.]|nr:ATP-grasp domain-containing protein [Thauera sp.]